jgi:hypothetical protein
MRLKEIDWEAPGGAAPIEIEYPDQVIADFMNWLRRTSRWKETPGEVEQMVRILNDKLRDHRERPRSPVLEEEIEDIEDMDTGEVKTDRFAAARAAKAAKRLLQVTG